MLQEQAVPPLTLGLLKQLSPELAQDGFYLAGGTALALRYGHRLSIDLDFFTEDRFEPSALLKKLEAIASAPFTVLNQSEGSLSLMVGKTKVEYFHYDYPHLEPVEQHNSITMASLPDNVAMKLSAVVGRGSKKDFADIATLIPEVGIETMLTWFQKKFPNTEVFALMKSLTWFDDAEQEPDPLFLRDQTWPEIKELIVESLK